MVAMSDTLMRDEPITDAYDRGRRDARESFAPMIAQAIRERDEARACLLEAMSYDELHSRLATEIEWQRWRKATGNV